MRPGAVNPEAESLPGSALAHRKCIRRIGRHSSRSPETSAARLPGPASERADSTGRRPGGTAPAMEFTWMSRSRVASDGAGAEEVSLGERSFGTALQVALELSCSPVSLETDRENDLPGAVPTKEECTSQVADAGRGEKIFAQIVRGHALRALTRSDVSGAARVSSCSERMLALAPRRRFDARPRSSDRQFVLSSSHTLAANTL
jgi:hypothetical protein